MQPRKECCTRHETWVFQTQSATVSRRPDRILRIGAADSGAAPPKSVVAGFELGQFDAGAQFDVLQHFAHLGIGNLG